MLVLAKRQFVDIALDKRMCAATAGDAVVAPKINVIVRPAIIGAHIRSIGQCLCPSIGSSEQEPLLPLAVKVCLDGVLMRYRGVEKKGCRCASPERRAK